jgi:hypothetical protein
VYYNKQACLRRELKITKSSNNLLHFIAVATLHQKRGMFAVNVYLSKFDWLLLSTTPFDRRSRRLLDENHHLPSGEVCLSDIYPSVSGDARDFTTQSAQDLRGDHCGAMCRGWDGVATLMVAARSRESREPGERQEVGGHAARA